MPTLLGLTRNVAIFELKMSDFQFLVHWLIGEERNKMSRDWALHPVIGRINRSSGNGRLFRQILRSHRYTWKPHWLIASTIARNFTSCAADLIFFTLSAACLFSYTHEFLRDVQLESKRADLDLYAGQDGEPWAPAKIYMKYVFWKTNCIV